MSAMATQGAALLEKAPAVLQETKPLQIGVVAIAGIIFLIIGFVLLRVLKIFNPLSIMKGFGESGTKLLSQIGINSQIRRDDRNERREDRRDNRNDRRDDRQSNRGDGLLGLFGRRND